MSAPLRLHHIGFVVASIDAAMPGFLQSLSARWDGRVFDDPHQKVRVAFLVTGDDDVQVELVEPAGGNSPVSRFLLDEGGGLHHVCYEVTDLEAQLAEFRSRGAMIAKRPKPAVAFNGRRIAWVITPQRLLVELLQAEGGLALRPGGPA